MLSPTSADNSWPGVLPVDGVQPWETVGADGRVISGIDLNAEFAPGFDTFQSGGDVTQIGDASRLASGLAGDKSVSFATYRVALGGDEPGIVSADINLAPNSFGLPSEYWLGMSNYGEGRWDWYGPLIDGHSRISLPTGTHTSPLGNLFVCALAFDGNAFDVVGFGAKPRSSADPVPPPQPSAPLVTPVNEGLHLEWLPVIAGDLAGYKVYYSDADFSAPTDAGVECLVGLEALTWHVLTMLNGTTYVRISAVDHAGTESPLSDSAVGDPLPGAPPVLNLAIDLPNCLRGETVGVIASGADTYDYDIDGDGLYDITGDTTGMALVDTGNTGIIRPTVRGMIGGSSCLACGSVSLVVSGNSRPVASAMATPSTGPVPLLVNFTGEGVDFDGSIAAYRWDFNGDGIYDYADFTSPNPTPQMYAMEDVYNVKFRVEDDQGAWDVDTVTVLATEDTGAGNIPPSAGFNIDHFFGVAPRRVVFDASPSLDSDGSIVLYEWDFTGDGNIDSYGTGTSASHVYQQAGQFDVTLYVTDNQGAKGSTMYPVTVDGWVTHPVITDNKPACETSLCKVNGNPAIFFVDETSNKAKYVRALDENGTAWGSVVDIGDTDAINSSNCKLRIINGKPAVFYKDDSFLMTFAIANDADGSTWGTPVNPLLNTTYAYGNDLCEVNGAPAVCAVDSVSNALTFIRATDANGTAWGTPVVVDNTRTVRPIVSMCDVGGQPAIAYTEAVGWDLVYCRATDADGSTWGVPLVIDNINNVHGGIVMTTAFNTMALDDAPVISYIIDALPDFTLTINFGMDATGTVWSGGEKLYTSGWIDEYVAMARTGPEQVIIAFNGTINSDLMYIEVNDMIAKPVETVYTYGAAGQGISIAELTNCVGISQFSNTNADIYLTSWYR